MKPSQCLECGEPVSWFARACARCGAANPARRTLVVVAAALVAVLVAGVVALTTVLLSERAPGTDDFAWLSKAMEECDKEAEKEPALLHLMVIPLVDEPRDDAGWRRASLNDIGNAILLSGENAIAGLKRGALRMSKEEYVLAVRDEATGVIFRWSPSVGVKRFVTKDASAVESFKVQFQKRDGTGGSEWGAAFKRQAGNCYWVNAIIRS
jgi:hypothetical protein